MVQVWVGVGLDSLVSMGWINVESYYLCHVCFHFGVTTVCSFCTCVHLILDNVPLSENERSIEAWMEHICHAILQYFPRVRRGAWPKTRITIPLCDRPAVGKPCRSLRHVTFACYVLHAAYFCPTLFLSNFIKLQNASAFSPGHASLALQPQKSGHGGDRPQFLLLFLPRYAKGFIRNKPGVATAVVSGLDSGVAYFWKAFPAAAGSEWDIVMMAGGGFQVQWVYPYVCTNGAIEWISFGWWLILSQNFDQPSYYIHRKH